MKPMRTLMFLLTFVPDWLFAEPMAQADLRNLVVRSVEAVARPMNLFIDPLVVDSMVDDVAIYYSTFCSAPGAACRFSASNSVALTVAIKASLNEYLTTQPTTMRTLASRIAGDGQMPLAGWPETGQVALAVVEFGRRYDLGALVIKRVPKNVELGWSSSKLLTIPGIVEIGEGRAPEIVWRRINLSANQTTAIEGGADLAREPSLGTLVQSADAYCPDEPVADARYNIGPLEEFNWGRSLLEVDDKLRYANLVQFAKNPAVDLTLYVDPAIKCERECQRDLSAVFAQAMAAWKGGCARCNANAFAVLRAADNVWMSSHLVARLREVDLSKPLPVLDLSRTPYGQASIPAGTATFYLRSSVAYANVTFDTALRKKVCALSGNDAPWLPASRKFLCEPVDTTVGSVGVTSAQLRILQRETACGEIAVACGLPNSRVELNALRYSFEVPRTKAVTSAYRLGSGPLSLDIQQVITHEVGHWFGVPHADIAGTNSVADIMSSNYGDGKPCISRNSAIMVNNAADSRWQYRVREGGALNPPRRAAGTIP